MMIPIKIIATVNSGRFVINQNERYSYKPRGSKIIWLSEPIDLVPDDNKIYEVKYPAGKLFEGIVSEVGEDEIGFYMILNVIGRNLRNDKTIINKTIPLGQATLIEVFNPNNITGLNDLSKSIGEQWQFALNSRINFEILDGNIYIFLKGGILNDIITKVEIIDVSKEDYLGLDYFNKIRIRNMFIRKENKEGFVIYLDSRILERFLVELPNEDFNNDEYSIEKDENIRKIYCNKIVFSHYNSFLKEMEKKNIDCISSDNCKTNNLNGKRLREQWINTFADNIDISKIYIEQHLWHVFSYKRLKCLEKEEANKKFDKIRKNSMYIFFDSSDRCYLIENAEFFYVEDFKTYENNDIYITNKDFTWTYVKTHEDGWMGPYFYSNELN